MSFSPIGITFVSFASNRVIFVSFSFEGIIFVSQFYDTKFPLKLKKTLLNKVLNRAIFVSLYKSSIKNSGSYGLCSCLPTFFGHKKMTACFRPLIKKTIWITPKTTLPSKTTFIHLKVNKIIPIIKKIL